MDMEVRRKCAGCAPDCLARWASSDDDGPQRRRVGEGGLGDPRGVLAVAGHGGL